MSYNLITGDNTPYKNSKAVKATDTASFRSQTVNIQFNIIIFRQLHLNHQNI